MKTSHPHCPIAPPIRGKIVRVAPTTPMMTTGPDHNAETFGDRQRKMRALQVDNPELDHVDSWTGIDN